MLQPMPMPILAVFDRPVLVVDEDEAVDDPSEDAAADAVDEDEDDVPDGDDEVDDELESVAWI